MQTKPKRARKPVVDPVLTEITASFADQEAAQTKAKKSKAKAKPKVVADPKLTDKLPRAANEKRRKNDALGKHTREAVVRAFEEDMAMNGGEGNKAEVARKLNITRGAVQRCLRWAGYKA